MKRIAALCLAILLVGSMAYAFQGSIIEHVTQPASTTVAGKLETATNTEAAAALSTNVALVPGNTFGTFSGTTIADNPTIPSALQALETAVEGKQSALTYPVTGVAAPTAGYLTKWGVAGNAIVDGPKLGTLTDTKWCTFTTANGLQCVEAAPSGMAAADAAGVNTGTSTTTAVTPDALAGSNAGTRLVHLIVQADDTALAVGNTSGYFRIPAEMEGMVLVSVGVQLGTVSSSGLPQFQVEKFHLSAAGTRDAAIQMLSTNATIDENEYDSKDATTAAVVSAVAGAATVATGDTVKASCVTEDGTGAKGGMIVLGFRLP